MTYHHFFRGSAFSLSTAARANASERKRNGARPIFSLCAIEETASTITDQSNVSRIVLRGGRGLDSRLSRFLRGLGLPI